MTIIDMVMAALLGISLSMVGINIGEKPVDFIFIVFVIVCYGIVVFGRDRFEKKDE